jgi:hypothetical protein
MIRHVLAGIGAGAASALYLYFTYHPLLLHGAIHAAIFASGIIAMFVTKMLTARKAGAYIAGALPVHLAIHFMVIGDLQFTGVSQSLNLSSLP